MSTSSDDRTIDFAGARNVRDLGGLPTRAGRKLRRGCLYRGDGLSRLTDDDVERLAALHIATIIDLRHPDECARAPDRLPAGHATRVRLRGFFPQGSRELFAAVNEEAADAARAFAIMCRNYSRIPFEHADELGGVLHDLLEDDAAPHLIHCTSGKDRTGIAVALVLRALDVDRDVVMADYLLSNRAHQPVDVFGPHAREDAVAMVMAAPAAYLDATLDAIDARCGGIERYLDNELGFGPNARAALAARLLE